MDLEALRHEIDDLDAELVLLLARRFAVTRKVGALKRSGGLTPRDAEREQAQIERVRRLAAEHELSPDLAEAVLRLVVDRVVGEHAGA